MLVVSGSYQNFQNRAVGNHKSAARRFRGGGCVRGAKNLLMSDRGGEPQSRQSARLFLQSSKLGPPAPSGEGVPPPPSGRRVCPPPLVPVRWGHTRLRE
jgi:hypothetical protein